MHIKSFAKLNLNLYVSPPQIGGLHSIYSIFQSISLYDDIFITPSSDAHSITFENQDIPEFNTCTHLVQLIESKLTNYWNIKIIKHIPSGAGLGGGSSNAAALLMALNQLESLNFSMDEMERISAQVGSDVAFFLHGGQCKVTGIGDCIEPVAQSIGPSYFILILPDIHCSTSEVYMKLDDMGEFDHLSGLTKENMSVIGYNRLLAPALAVSPDLKILYDNVRKVVDGRVFMSGSGSTLVVLCDDESMQHAVFEQLDGVIDARIERVSSVVN